MTPYSGAADALGVRQRQLEALAGRVLLDGRDAGDAAALLVLAADQVARALGGDHADVDVGRMA